MNKLIVLFIAIIFSSCSSPQKKSSEANDVENRTYSDQVASGEKDSELFIEKLNLSTLDHEPIQMSAYKDKILILNLWATWCKPCIKEMPDMETMMTQLPEEFELLLASNEDVDRIKKFRESKQWDLNFVKLENSIESLGAYALPTTFIIGKNGELLETLVGARDWKSQETIEILTQIIK